MFERSFALSILSTVLRENPLNLGTIHYRLLNLIDIHKFQQSARQKYDTPQLTGFCRRRNKEKMEKTEVNRINRNGPEHAPAAEVKAKKMMLYLTLYDNTYSLLNDMDINNLMGGNIAVTIMRANIFLSIGYFETIKPLSGSVRDCHVAMLDIPTDKLQKFLRNIPKKVITWHHRDVGAFQFLHKDIYGR